MGLDRATCFLLQPTDRLRLYLRRFAPKSDCPVKGRHGSYHNAMKAAGECTREEWAARHAKPDDESRLWTESYADLGTPPPDDPRWPALCDCGYAFQPGDTYQLSCDGLWIDPRTGRELVRAEFPPGAMFDAEWLKPWYAGPDGLSLCVILPNGDEWHVDGVASNCELAKHAGRPAGKWCWQRSGTPPNVTVARTSCPNCGVGGGSIRSGDYHGYLTGGEIAP